MTLAPLAARRLSVPWLVAGLLLFAGLVALLTAGGDPAGPSQFGPVTVEGAPLPADGSAGMPAPALVGVDVHRDPVEVRPGRPTLLVFVAHWCAHCQAEVPRVVRWHRDGGGGGLRLVAVSTAQSASKPNWPATRWLEAEGWPGALLLDDEAGTAARAFGVTALPVLRAARRGRHRPRAGVRRAEPGVAARAGRACLSLRRGARLPACSASSSSSCCAATCSTWPSAWCWVWRSTRWCRRSPTAC